MKKEELFDSIVEGNYVVTNFKLKNSEKSFLLSKYTQTHMDQAAADEYMSTVISFIKEVKKELKGKKNLRYDSVDVTKANLANIEAWTCKITVISDLPFDEFVHRMLTNFEYKFQKKIVEIDLLINKRKEDFYSLTMSEEERLINLNAELNYGLEEEFLKYANTVMLENMNKNASEILSMLKEINK